MKKLTFLLAICGIAGVILHSCNKNESPDPPAQLTPVAWVVGAQDDNQTGVILYSTDNGETWVRQGDPNMFKNIDLMDVWAIDNKNVWVIGTGNKIFRTLDGGASWIAVAPPQHPANPDLYSIFIYYNTQIWISGDHGAVYHSTDAGSSWEMFDTAFFHSGLMQGIWAAAPNLVYVAGQYSDDKKSRGFFAVTPDGGITWDSIDLPDDFNRHEWIGISSSSSLNVMVYGQMGHYAFTHDGGATWHTDSIQSGDFNHLIMLSQTVYWVATDFDKIFKSFDGGNSWNLQACPPPSNYFMVGIDAWNSQEALAVGLSASSNLGKIIRTTDGGATWALKDTINAHLWKVSYAKY
jgi:photosystem II stability/assembly factor-like uncharacterized protein